MLLVSHVDVWRFRRASWLQGSGSGSGSCAPRFSHRDPCNFTFLHVVLSYLSTVAVLFNDDRTICTVLLDTVILASTATIYVGIAAVGASEHLQISQIPNCACSRPTPHSAYFRQGFGSQLSDRAHRLVVGLVPLSAPTNPKPWETAL